MTLYLRSRQLHNMAINSAPFGRWTLRRGAAHRQLFLR